MMPRTRWPSFLGCALASFAACSSSTDESADAIGTDTVVSDTGTDTVASDTGTDTVASDTPDAPTATGFATRFGITSYEVALGDGATSDFHVTLRGAGDIPLGTFDVRADTDGLVATISSPPDVVVFRTSSRIEGDLLLSTWSIGPEYATLRLDTTSTIDANGQLVPVRELLTAPTVGNPFPYADDSFVPAALVPLELLGPDGERGAGAVGTFIDFHLIQNVRWSPELARLAFAMLDPAFVAAVEEAAETFAPAPVGNGLHLSAVCASLRDKVRADPIPPCRTCAELDPDRKSTIPTLVDSPLALTYLPACRKCMLANNVKEADAASCVRTWRRPQSITTDESCRSQSAVTTAQVHERGGEVYATADGHGCENRCDEAMCSQACSQRYAGASDLGPACDHGACQCHPPAAGYCAAQHPDTYCRPDSEADDRCQVAVCGDGTITRDCPAHTGATEQCDPGAADNGGCPFIDTCGKKCQCESCDCAEGESCPEGRVCSDGCRCLPSSCAVDLIDLVYSEGDWCTPATAQRWCGAGRTCDAQTCRCSPAPAPACGDGKRDPGEACDQSAPNPNDGCATGETCGGCVCSGPSLCGNGVIDSGEQCDPNAASPACPANTTCHGCTCVANCGNGVIDSGEGCDTAAPNTCGSGSACTSQCTCQPICGNGQLDENEACDRSATSQSPQADCPAEACQEDCTCAAPECGNGFFEGGEECETPGDNLTQCNAAGFPDFHACNELCECVSLPNCGNGVVDGFEVCDYMGGGPGPCGTGMYEGSLAQCEARWCRCQCPDYARAPCTFQGGLQSECFVDGQTCDPDKGCIPASCPPGSTRFPGGSCGCDTGTMIFDYCRSNVPLRCQP